MISKELRPNSVMVWVTDPSQVPANCLTDLKGALSEWEQDRFDSLHRYDDRRRYVTAHLLIREALSILFPVAIGEWRLDRTPEGKPVVQTSRSPHEIHVSISHTERLVGCAIARRPVGLDLETVSHNLDTDAMLTHTLTPEELSHWPYGFGNDPVRRFLKYWTLKEALSKALGVGMAVPFSKLGFDLDDRETVELIELPDEFGETSSWQMRLLDLGETHMGALAIGLRSGRILDVRVDRIDANTLL